MTQRTKYQAAIDYITDHHGAIVCPPEPVQILATQLRKLGRGQAYIGTPGGGRIVVGITRDGVFLAPAGDSARKATLALGEPKTDAERDALTRAITEYISDHPQIAGSSYDPTFSRNWDAHRAILTELRAR